MKKFIWPLRRVLELKCKQENLYRRQLVSLTEQTAAVRSQIIVAKADLRMRCSQIKNAPPDTRLARQEMFLRFVHVIDEKIKSLQLKLQQLEQQRNEMLAKVLHLRRERKALQKLHQKAKEQFIYEQNRLDQKNLDEQVNNAFARNLITAQVAPGL